MFLGGINLRKRASTIIFTLLASTTLLTACTTGLWQSQSVDLLEKLSVTNKTVANATMQDLVTTEIKSFSSDLFKASAENSGNILISPASAYIALAMTFNGSQGDTKLQMQQVLGSDAVDKSFINKSMAVWTKSFQQSINNTTLNISDSIWFDKNFSADMNFLSTIAKNYSASLRKMDFTGSNAADIINSWVNYTTKGKINKIIDSISKDSAMFLINTLYFKADWLEPFEKNNTHKLDFATNNGKVNVNFLNGNIAGTYYEEAGAKIMALPYANKNFAYFAILPEESKTPRQWIADNTSKGTALDIAALIAKGKEVNISVSMPKFKAEYEDSLKEELIAMGMKDAFIEGKADFLLMSSDHETQLYIDDVKQKTFLAVDEKGTEAAAATVVGIKATSAPIQEYAMNLNRPFIYGIMDMKTGVPVFEGILENPQ